MSDLALPPPDDDGLLSAAAAGATGGGRRKRKAQSNAGRRRSTANRRLTLEEIVQRLESLAGMVAAGWIKPAQANAMARIYHLLMQGLQQGGPRQTSSGVPDEILADVVRRDPAVLNLLAPFLTDEQFNSILEESVQDEPNLDQEAAENDPV